MVKKGFIRVMFATAALTVASCATNGDIDDLKGQLDDLQGQVGQLEQQQQAALLAQITRLEGEIAALQGELDGTQDAISADYDALLESLTDLQNEVASGAKVHYGAVLTNEDFDSFMASESTIVTGDVVITSADQIAKLEKLALVGGNLEIKGGDAVALPNLESVSGMLTMDGDATSVSLAMLKSVGKGVSVSNTTALTSVDMPELLLVNGNFTSENVLGLESLTMAKLDVISGDLMIDNAIPGDKTDFPYGALKTMELSEVHVMGNVDLLFLAETELTSLGNVDGDLNVINVGLSKFTSNATTIGGDFMFYGNYMASVLDFPALVTVGGDITIADNGIKNCWFFPCTEIGALTEITGFDALETIGGNVEISGNAILTKIETFNNVVSLMGDVTNPYAAASVTIERNGTLELMNVFNKLTTTKENRNIDIMINQKADWYILFEELPIAQSIYFEVNPEDYYKLEGFNNMETIPGGTVLDLSGVSELNAFSKTTGFHDFYKQSIFYMLMPFDTTVSLCSMNGIFTDLRDNSATSYGGRMGTYSDGRTDYTVEEVITMHASDCQ